MAIESELPNWGMEVDQGGVVRKKVPNLRIGADKRTARGSITYIVPAGQLKGFLEVVGGKAELVGNGVTRVVPLRHPYYPFMVADRVECEGWGMEDGNPTHWFATVDFATPDYDLDGKNAFLTIEGQGSHELVPLPNGSIKFLDGSRPTQAVGYPMGSMTVSVTIHQLPYLDLGRYLPYVGRANNAGFFGWPAGHVKYAGVAFYRTSTFSGVTTYQVTHQFQCREVPWGFEQHPDGITGWAQLLYNNNLPVQARTDISQVFYAI